MSRFIDDLAAGLRGDLAALTRAARTASQEAESRRYFEARFRAAVAPNVTYARLYWGRRAPAAGHNPVCSWSVVLADGTNASGITELGKGEVRTEGALKKLVAAAREALTAKRHSDGPSRRPERKNAPSR